MSIKKEETYEWLLYKHYAKRLAPISYAFGLYDKSKLVGVMTFGCPPNKEYNDGKCVFNNMKIKVLELNRLIVNDGLKKNSLSFFVSQSLRQLKKPLCIVSYADPNHNHYGFIYQATNWIYTGKSSPKHRYYFEDGSTFDIRRGIENKGKVVRVEKLKRTHRYLYFLANKKTKKNMYKNLKFDIKKYPKGDSQKYDTNYKPSEQKNLFI